MAVTIRKMTTAEFENFYRWSIGQQAEELVEELRLFPQDAIQQAAAEVAQMLPDGLDSENNFLMTIVEQDSGENAGFIWTLHEETEGRKQSFLCDFAVWQSKRRRGYAAAALELAEKNAAQAGCLESVLFLSDDNLAARALYEKCGYKVLRQEGYGKYMIKQLAQPE